jgi:hypothetical protein
MGNFYTVTKHILSGCSCCPASGWCALPLSLVCSRSQLQAAITPHTCNMQLYLPDKNILNSNKKQSVKMQLMLNLEAVCFFIFSSRTLGARLPGARAPCTSDKHARIPDKTISHTIRQATSVM